MNEFKQYRRTGLSEMRPVALLEIEGDIDPTISISQVDLDNGSPKSGDMIARNPKEHEDRWLVAKQYLEDNLELADTTAKQFVTVPITENDLQDFNGLVMLDSFEPFTWTFPDQNGNDVNITFVKEI